MSINIFQATTSANTWGRSAQSSKTSFLTCLSLLTLAPVLVLYYLISAFYFDCSLFTPLQAIVSQSTIDLLAPLPTYSTFLIFAFWLGLQMAFAVIPDYLHRIIPNYQGGYCQGAITPAGNCLTYNINGLQAWVLSHVLFLLGAFVFHLFPPAIIFNQWIPLFWIANFLGFAVSIFVYAKAYFFPSHPKDRKFSGNFIYDFFMGVELNPRIKNFDIKLFFNGRPGIVAWTLINFSFACKQYENLGHITNSMILVNLFQLLYVLYFFWKEAWYLKTIDIHHDHFGWMLAWGDCVWLPYMYTLQGLFLVFHPVELSFHYAVFVLVLGLLGFYIFASANNQKDKFRKNVQSTIWRKSPKSITANYTTLDGNKRELKLLVSGWWGISRHMNYTGDLLLSLAYSLACGIDFFFPYFYFIFLSILLIHRCLRDEERCRKKYGPTWKDYCNKVPYRLIPYIW